MDSPHEDEGFGKLEIVRALAARYDYRRYLEITTGETGHVYARARHAGFEDCRRIVYRLDVRNKDDNQPIDFPVRGEDTSKAISHIRERGLRFDVILVDPHHTYQCSLRDITDAFSLIRTSGALVVHDCNPPNATMASPDYFSGLWCGVTYKAFLDFVIDNEKIRYFTVDTDCGCGVILKRPPRQGLRKLRDLFDRMTRLPGARELRRRWRAVGTDYEATYSLFEQEKKALLRLIGPEEFVRRYGMPAPVDDAPESDPLP